MTHCNRMVRVKAYHYAVILAVILCAACASPRANRMAPADRPTGIITYNIEIVADADTARALRDVCNPDQIVRSISTDVRPTPHVVTRVVAGVTYADTLIRVLALPCDGGKPTAERKEYLIPLERIVGKRYTGVSDPLEPPTRYSFGEAEANDVCCRLRTGWWIFDKLELRLGAGFRFGSDSVTYPIVDANSVPVAPFQQTYYSSFVNFDRGGSNLVPSVEVSGLFKLDRSGYGHIGPWLAFMPTDGSAFIPVGVHGRYTFAPAPRTDEIEPSCHTPYLYGLAGLPLDFSSGAPLFGSTMARQRLMLGAGIGYDWAATCDLDVSVDVGVRHMNLPLPEIDCCPNVPDEQRNPFRESTMFMLRFGLTF
jgi:hypothetical protein